MSFDLLSVCRVATAEFELAAVLHGAGEALWTLLNAPVLMGPGYAEIRKGAADTARAALGEERFDELLSRGLAMHLADALAMAKGETPADGVLGGESGASAVQAAHQAREGDRGPGRGRPRQPRDRRAALPVQAHRGLPHGAHLHQARLLVTDAAGELGARAGQGPVAGPFLRCRSLARCPAFILRHQYSSRTSAATFPPVTGRLPADGKVSACPMTRSPACPGGSCSLQARPG